MKGAGHISATIEIHTGFVAAAAAGLADGCGHGGLGRRTVHTQARNTDSGKRLIATA